MSNHERNVKRPKVKYKVKMEVLEKAGRERVYFDLTKHAHNLLKKTSHEKHVPKAGLLEIMIRTYCEPNKERPKSDF